MKYFILESEENKALGRPESTLDNIKINLKEMG
jgi:hypothetical protein